MCIRDRFVKNLDWSESRSNRFSKDPSGTSESYFEKRKNPIMGWNKAWNERWVEFDAESRNYLSAVVMNKVKNDSDMWKASLKGDDQEVTNKIYDSLRYKLRAGDRIHRRIVDKNDQELRTLAERVADRIIEVVELYDPDWYRDSSNRPSGYSPLNSIVSDFSIGNWLEGKEYINRRNWGDYWRFIHDKVIGAV